MDRGTSGEQSQKVFQEKGSQCGPWETEGCHCGDSTAGLWMCSRRFIMNSLNKRGLLDRGGRRES